MNPIESRNQLNSYKANKFTFAYSIVHNFKIYIYGYSVTVFILFAAWIWTIFADLHKWIWHNFVIYIYHSKYVYSRYSINIFSHKKYSPQLFLLKLSTQFSFHSLCDFFCQQTKQLFWITQMCNVYIYILEVLNELLRYVKILRGLC